MKGILQNLNNDLTSRLNQNQARLEDMSPWHGKR